MAYTKYKVMQNPWNITQWNKYVIFTYIYGFFFCLLNNFKKKTHKLHKFFWINVTILTVAVVYCHFQLYMHYITFGFIIIITNILCYSLKLYILLLSFENLICNFPQICIYQTRIIHKCQLTFSNVLNASHNVKFWSRIFLFLFYMHFKLYWAVQNQIN